MKTINKEKNKRVNPKVKLGASRQIAIPKRIYDDLNLSAGDYLEMEVANSKIILTPKVFVAKGVIQGLADIKNGKITGPFNNIDDLVKELEA